ncbi:MAG: PQQ-binding-like beta-propeller repeat protein [Thermoguttaceae bacterium]|jgi:outer membrane protein assembly factor BamB
MQIAAFVLLLSFAAPAATEEPWPQFLGPAANGSCRQADLPTTWSEKDNIRWKTAIHDRGHSSPVVWDKQVWLTTAAADGKRLYAVCVDRDSGRIVHDIRVFEVEKPEPIAGLNSYASPTPVIEAGRIYVHFGTYGTACLDTSSGKTLWSRRDLHCNHYRGPGSSAFVYKNLLILTFDGIDVQYLVALDKQTGATVWKTDRSTDYAKAEGDLRKAYSTPIVIEAGGAQLISCGAYAAEAYVPETGREIWKVCYPGGFSNVSRPLYGQGLLFLNTGFGRPEIWAVRPDGHGDISQSHVVWKSKARNLPAKPSSVLAGELLFSVNDNGVATCLEAKTGATIWQERIHGFFSASALYAPDRVYFFDQDGKTTAIAPERKLKVLAVNQLDQGCMASPAVAGKALILRTKTHLYRIEE